MTALNICRNDFAPTSKTPETFAHPALRLGIIRWRSVGGWLFALILLVAMTTSTVAAEIPRAEHPRPDALRTNWLSLNGEWQFEVDRAGDGVARGLVSGQDLDSKIIVPFCPESKLSGLGWGNTNYFENAWYRRIVTLPAPMASQRVLLHFGAVDYQTWVYVNGEFAGTHVGGSAAFQFEITKFLHAGENELVVRIHDALRSGLQPGGKQATEKSEGCMYTRTTGIWQPVWLEAVGSSYVEEFSVVPDVDRNRVLIEATVNGEDPGLKLVASAYAGDKLAGSDSSSGSWRNHRLVLDLKTKKLWSPKSPFLYDLKFSLYRGTELVDEVRSYFGLRKVAIAGRRILINDEPVFQRLILDQGFYPDGIWTAPTEEELRKDIERSQAAGFNGARLHQKVFEPRFLYWADKLGYIVWGEFPSWGFNFDPAAYPAYLEDWTEVVRRDRNHPAIIGWCPFNETGDDAAVLQQLVWQQTKAIDPTRPLLETSGYTHSLPNPEVRDAHDYDGNPASFRQRWVDYFSGSASGRDLPMRYRSSLAPEGDCGVPYMISEIGGIGWATEGGWGYGSAPKALDEFYTRYQGTVDALLDNPNLFGFCYTQLTDVEQEHNGLYYYDRRPKFDLNKLHAITSRQAEYERGETVAPMPARARDAWKVLTGAAPDGKLCTPWQYTTQTPGADWQADNTGGVSWTEGQAPFGREGGNRLVRSSWTSGDLYLKKTIPAVGLEIKNAALVLWASGASEVYLNGQKIFETGDRSHRYEQHDVTDALRKALRPGGNTLAAHVHQSGNGQYVDLALLYQ